MACRNLAQMDAVRGRPDGTAGRAYRTHKARLNEGRHYFRMNLDEFRRGFPAVAPERGGGDVTLLTERGYLVLVKSFTDDLAWQVQEQLVDGYFRAKVPQALPSYPEALRMLAATIEECHGGIIRIPSLKPPLSHDSQATSRQVPVPHSHSAI